MPFDPEAARKSVLPKIEDDESRRHAIYAQMLAELRLAIDSALDVIAESHYRGGGTVVYETGDFSQVTKPYYKANENLLQSRVAWIVSQISTDNDGSVYYTNTFIDEKKNITTMLYGRELAPFEFSNLRVIPLFNYQSGIFHRYEVTERGTYPRILTYHLQKFCGEHTTLDLPSEATWWEEYKSILR